jgi:hypothetical protein
VAQRLAAAADRCARARENWRAAADAAHERTAALDRCLVGAGYRCRTEAAAVAPALSSLEWAEQEVDERCP